MRRLRISISSAIGLILLAGVFLAALRSGSNDWFKTIYSLTFVVLLYAGIAARYRGPFWHGFAVVGWAYFLVGFGAWMDGQAPAKWQRVVNRDLVTSVLIEVITMTTSAPPQAPPEAGATVAWVMQWDNASANRDGIAHSAITLFSAWIGGLFSRRLAARTALATGQKRPQTSGAIIPSERTGTH